MPIVIKPQCIWMIGISGSGKSETAKQISKEKGYTILSSDNIREELYGDPNIQGEPQKVFGELHSRAIHLLKNGLSIIYDATNLSLKNRTRFFKQLKDANVEVEHHAIVMSKSVVMCIADNNKRDRVVPENIIHKQVRSFNMPFFEEGFKTITITGWKNFDRVTEDDIRYAEVNIKSYSSIINVMDDFNQNNPHHELTVGYHCDTVQKIVSNFSDDIALITASLFHDVGKLYTQTTDEKGISHYYGHAEVGTYYLLQNLDALNGLGMRSKDVIKSLFYCNYHMRPFDWKNDQIKEKYRKIFGKENYNNLWLLHNADIRGCKKYDKNVFDVE